MSETLKFGPEWLRALSSGNSVTSPPPSPGLPKFKLAEHRYGREEMLALFVPNTPPPDGMKEFSVIYNEKALQPLAFLSPTDEEQATASHTVNSSQVLRLMGRGGNTGSRGVPRGGQVDRGRGRGRGRADGWWGASYEDDSGFIRTRLSDRVHSLEDKGDRGGFSRPFPPRGNFDDHTLDRDEEPRLRRTEYSRSMSTGNWRRNDFDRDDEEDGGGWRIASSHHRTQDKYGRQPAWRDRGPLRDREPPRTRHFSAPRPGDGQWNEGGQNNSQEIPEWSTADVDDDVGTFDSSGAFLSSKMPTDNNKQSESSSKIKDQHKKSDNSLGANKSVESNKVLDARANDSSAEAKDNVEDSKRTSETIRHSRSSSDGIKHTDNISYNTGRPSRLKSADDVMLSETISNTLTNSHTVNMEKTVSHSVSVAETVEHSAPRGEVDTSAATCDKVNQVQCVSASDPRPNVLSTREEDMLDHIKSATENLVETWTAEEEFKQLTTNTVSVEALPLSHPDAHKWFYRDPQGEIQGPFTSKEMRDWFTAGFFTMTLNIKRGCDSVFLTLGELIKRWGRVPFIEDSNPPPISTSSDSIVSGPNPELAEHGDPVKAAAHQQLIQQQLLQAQVLHARQQDYLRQQAHMAQLLTHLKQQPYFAQLPPQEQMETLQTFLARNQARVLPNSTNSPMLPDPSHQTSASSAAPNKAVWDLGQAVSHGTSWPTSVEPTSIWDLDQTNSAAASAEFERRQAEEALQRKKAAEQEQTRHEEALRLAHEEEKKREEERRMEMERLEIERKRQEELRLQEEQRRFEEERRQREEEQRQREEEQRRIEEQRRLEAERRRREEKEQQKREEERRRHEEEQRRLEEEQRLIEEEERRMQIELEKKEKEAAERRSREEAEKKALAAAKLAPWAQHAKHQQASASVNLSRIQQAQEERERSEAEIRQQQAALQREQLQQHQQQQSANFSWVTRETGKNSHVKSLLEIQEEEARCLKSEAKQQSSTSSNVSLASAAGWGGKSTSLNGSGEGLWSSYAKSGGFWDDDVPSVKSLAKNTNSSPRKDPNFPTLGVQNGPVNTKLKNNKREPRTKREEENVLKLFEKHRETTTDEFTQWCTNALNHMQHSVDIPTFIQFLRDVDSPYEIQDYVRSYLGENKEAREFAKKFLEKRSKYRNQRKPSDEDKMWGPAPAITPVTNPKPGTQASCEVASGASGKKKKKRMQKLDSSVLGFTVLADPNRVNAGEIDNVEIS